MKYDNYKHQEEPLINEPQLKPLHHPIETITLDPKWPAAMKANQAAQYCGLGERTFRSLVASGWVSPRKIGPRCIRYLRVDLDTALSDLPYGRGEMRSGTDSR